MTWSSILAPHWREIEADLHDVYGVDLGDPAIQSRSWRWLSTRILGLFDTPPSHHLRLPVPGSKTESYLRPVFATRVQVALQPKAS